MNSPSKPLFANNLSRSSRFVRLRSLRAHTYAHAHKMESDETGQTGHADSGSFPVGGKCGGADPRLFPLFRIFENENRFCANEP